MLIFLSLDQASLQDVICTVEDSDHQEPPSSSPEVSLAAEDQRVEDVQPQDQDSPASLSVGECPPHLLRQLDCDEIMRIESEFTVITKIKHTHITIYYFVIYIYNICIFKVYILHIANAIVNFYLSIIFNHHVACLQFT